MRADQKSDSRDKKKEIHLITFDDPEYPLLLKEIKDPPKTLYYIGRKELLQTRCAAVISAPLRTLAWTTTVSSDRPLMMRLRMGK